MTEVKNLDALAEQIYREGIKKAKKESKELLDEAKIHANEIVDKAKTTANAHLKKAEKEVERLKKSAFNEIQHKTNQAVSDLKLKIESLIKLEVLHQALEKSFDESDFVSELILKATDKWATSDELELWLSPKMNAKIESYLNNKLKEKLPGLTIIANADISRGFRIKAVQEGYYISFTAEDFSEFLDPYFSEQLQIKLFKPSKD